MSKSVKIKSLLANLFIKFGLILILAVVIFLAAGIAGNADVNGNTGIYDVWINGAYVGRQNITTTEDEAGVIIPLVLGVAIISGLIVLITRKRLVDFEQCYTPLSEGTAKRKLFFGLSVVLGWCGADRFALRCWFRGALKFFLAFWTFAGMLNASLTAMEYMRPMFFYMFLGSLVFLVYWWMVDMILIGMGAAKNRNKEYLR